ncbi:NUDIX domain-containing protein [Streptomyces sp. SID3343]|uniref:NUDIX domain-containing protein n=1 Tax=Streptomyces sp. SID3343 TaxID=2690260 RepID=UPI00136E46A0|nr:NUDIX domain-containing protein [Streptomyces sp. SID3343]MYV97152.1 NUDIX domain-containing protein [Streptomyces sp. SID3343]
MGYVGSYIWSLRRRVGSRPLLVPGAHVLLVDEAGRGLLQRRADLGVWEVPAGSCEEGTTFVSTAVAELAEETGLSVEERDLVPFASLSDPAVNVVEYPNGDVVHAFTICFVAHRWTGELVLEPEEVTDAAFFDLADLPTPMHRPTEIVLGLYRDFTADGRFRAR